MSWSDLLYPGNPEKRERLMRKSQEVLELMKNNFRATNQLIETLKKHLGLSFSPITLNEKATVKTNCDVIIKRIHEIQAELEKIDQKLKEQLEPSLYEKLKNMSLSVHDYSRFSTVFHRIFGVAVAVSTVLVAWLIKSGTILRNITVSFGILAASAIGFIVLSVLSLGIELIVQGILGAIERNELNKALKEYELALEEFRPASEQYQDSITYVRIRVEIN